MGDFLMVLEPVPGGFGVPRWLPGARSVILKTAVVRARGRRVTG